MWVNEVEHGSLRVDVGERGRTWLTRTHCKFYMSLKAYILSAMLLSIWHSAMAYIPRQVHGGDGGEKHGKLSGRISSR